MSAAAKPTIGVAPAPMFRAGDALANQRRAERETAAHVTEQLAALQTMPLKDLAAKFLELFGYPTRTHNRVNLRKRLAWKIQEVAYGGLSPRALERIEELAPLAPTRWSRPREKVGDGTLALVPVGRDATPSLASARDPRLPAPGTVITKMHAGVEHRVTVLEDGGFEYQGARYRSLSAVARTITSTNWNGFLFFFGRAAKGDATEVTS